MGYPVARLGDTSDHGGKIISASPTFSVDGVAVARVGDLLDCPQHGKNPIISGSSSHQQDGKDLAHIGSMTKCGAIIITGSNSFLLGD